jgi:peptide-methionine (R)-S-oxide reductase
VYQNEHIAMAGKTFPVTRTDEEWRQILTPEQYEVMRAHETEAPDSCTLLLEKPPELSPAPVADSPSSNPK